MAKQPRASLSAASAIALFAALCTIVGRNVNDARHRGFGAAENPRKFFAPATVRF
jgi:hypothetical protein